MWARIENGVVVEMIDFDPAGKFHGDLEWVRCNSGISLGMSCISGAFGPAPAPDVKRLAMDARAKRDKLLREVYDVGVIQLKREERAGADVAAKISALDDFAILLLNVPQQSGFPTTIIWPEEPNHGE